MPIKLLRRHLLDRMVLRPSRHTIDHGVQQRRVLECLGRPLECFVQEHHSDDDSPRVLVIKFPGTSGRAEQSTGLPLTLLDGVGGTTWTWNPPGYGGSHGRASLPIMADAAIAFVRQVIESEADDRTTVWLAGNSLGCATALNVAAAIDLDPSRTGLVLRNPPPLVEVVKRIAHQYPLGRLLNRLAESVHDPMNVHSTSGKVRLPAVFLQSGADTLVPPEMQDRVIESYRGNLQRVWLEGLAHDGLATEEQEHEIRLSLHWLLRQTS
jgi:pimeloyl-ACP methyl ester carboxylesterase